MSSSIGRFDRPPFPESHASAKPPQSVQSSLIASVASKLNLPATASVTEVFKALDAELTETEQTPSDVETAPAETAGEGVETADSERKQLTESLGLPETATDAEIVEALKGPGGESEAAAQALYAVAFGREPNTPATPKAKAQGADDALYNLAFGGRSV